MSLTLDLYAAPSDGQLVLSDAVVAAEVCARDVCDQQDHSTLGYSDMVGYCYEVDYPYMYIRIVTA